VGAIIQERVGALLGEYNDRLDLKVSELLAHASNQLDSGSETVHEEMTEKKDGIFQWMKEKRDRVLQQTRDAKIKWWSEGPKRERLTDLHKRREGEAQKHHDRLREELRLDYDKRLEDAIRQMREAAQEDRDQMQKDFSDKA
jgi:hypothetical protein